MKMSDVFQLPMVQGSTVLMSGDHRYAIEFDSSDTNTGAQIEHVAHAINNHDRMVEENKKLLIALCDIQSMCIGDIAMGYKLDPESIGMMIYEATGMTHPELSAKLNQEGEELNG